MDKKKVEVKEVSKGKKGLLVWVGVAVLVAIVVVLYVVKTCSKPSLSTVETNITEVTPERTADGKKDVVKTEVKKIENVKKEVEKINTPVKK